MVLLHYLDSYSTGHHSVEPYLNYKFLHFRKVVENFDNLRVKKKQQWLHFNQFCLLLVWILFEKCFTYDIIKEAIHVQLSSIGKFYDNYS